MNEREDWEDDSEAEGNGEPLTVAREESVGGPALAEMQGQLLRMRADFENYRRRNATASADARRKEKASVQKALLPVYDNFVRALDSAETHEEVVPYMQGLEMIREHFERFFSEQGALAICPAIGEEFDPNMHEAAGVVPAINDEDAGMVAHLVQIGFAMDDLLLRPAQVLVYSEGN